MWVTPMVQTSNPFRERLVTDFPIAAIRYHHQVSLQKKELLWVSRFQRVRIDDLIVGSMAAGR